jgi:hypothetical protein
MWFRPNAISEHLEQASPARSVQIGSRRSIGRENAMTAATLESPAPAAPHTEIEGVNLTFATEELARLRFAILLTARWEASETEDPEHRKELLAELSDLRRLYYDRIDEVAMAFGVAQAMKTKAEIERSVVLPSQTRSAEPARVDNGLYF